MRIHISRGNPAVFSLQLIEQLFKSMSQVLSEFMFGSSRFFCNPLNKQLFHGVTDFIRRQWFVIGAAIEQGLEKRIELMDIEQARQNALSVDWQAAPIVSPALPGVTVIDDVSIEMLVEYIDWTPFFFAWELKGRYPKILDDEHKGEEARKLFKDAEDMLDAIIEEKWLTAKAVIGLYPANSVNEDDIEVYSDDSRKTVLATLHNLRQQTEKPPGKPNASLSDFIAPRDSGVNDYIGTFAVTTGFGVDEKVAEFEKDHDDYKAIMLKALADRLAEAFTELMHQKVRYGLDSSQPTPRIMLETSV